MKDCRRHGGWIAEGETRKGQVCTVVEKGSDWLGSPAGPRTKDSMDGKVRLVDNKYIDHLWEK
jgi:hypothetical protein